MKKLVSAIVLAFAVANVGLTQINFETISLADAMKKAKEEDKKIFVDVYTSWCGPCKMMDSQVFSDVKVGERMSKEYVSVKVENEKSESRKDFTKYHIKGYPTMLILDENGTELGRIYGRRSLEEFNIELDKYSAQKYSPFSQALIVLEDKSTGQEKWKESLVYLNDNINSLFSNNKYDLYVEACKNYYTNFDITTYDGDGDLKIFRYANLPVEHPVTQLYLKDSNEYAHYRHKDYMVLSFKNELKNAMKKSEKDEIKERAKKYYQDHFNRLGGDVESEEYFMDQIYLDNINYEEEIVDEKVVEEEVVKTKKKKKKKM